MANWFLTNTGLKMEVFLRCASLDIFYRILIHTTRRAQVLMELKMDIKANSAGGPRSPGKSSGGDLAATDGDVAEVRQWVDTGTGMPSVTDSSAPASTCTDAAFSSPCSRLPGVWH